MESEFEVVDDIVYYFMIFDKSNDFHFCTAVGQRRGVYLIGFADHPGPAFGGQRVVFLRDDQRMRGRDSILAYLTSVGIGVIIVENWEDLWLAKKKEILIKKWVKQDIFASYIIGHIYFENTLRK